MAKTNSFKEAKAALRALRSGRISKAEEGFRKLSESNNKYALVGFIGLAAAESAKHDYNADKITEYLSEAARYGAYAAGFTITERVFMKRLVNNSFFPEYRLPLIYFARTGGTDMTVEMLLALGADKNSL